MTMAIPAIEGRLHGHFGGCREFTLVQADPEQRKILNARFMAGAGIVVRNSIILVDFIEQRLREGLPLAKAVVEAGMIRFRPILLTALAVVVGATVILFDPIFQGLAISLMAGSLVSMIIAPVTVPLLYFMAHNRKLKP
jgi:multidrug efflux pump subunit AcrB